MASTRFALSLLLLFIFSTFQAQNQFNYTVQLNPIQLTGLPGLHSYAFAQDNNKWLIIGGRLDGLHARQPFNAFPQNQNNTTIYVADLQTNQVWSASLNSLPTGIKEQLQSTNMNFYQDHDSLIIIGGYGYSPSANNHITFPNLTTVDVPGLMQAIISNGPITSYFKQISNANFAVTGGQLGKLNGEYYLVGGHRFDGRYNPMGNPSYTQSYTNQIRKFTLHNQGPLISISNYNTITDAVHLHRRDYNLLPQIFPDGTFGYTISSGVFQNNVNLPFLYPVDITANGISPITSFNQYLSNYHSAKACLYDSLNNEMHTLFFGGMSQYYYQNGNLIQDTQVPFVKTISLLSRYADSSLHESQFSVEMPNFKGASAEFIPNHAIAHYESEIIKLSPGLGDTILIGHIYGGILSNSPNPFSVNQTSTTSADPSIYEVQLIRSNSIGLSAIEGANPFKIDLYPNPIDSEFTVEFTLDEPIKVHYMLSTELGQVFQEGDLDAKAGQNSIEILLSANPLSKVLYFTMVIDDTFFLTEKLIVNP